jgi:integrase
MRRGEALGFRWTDLKLDCSPPTVTIRRAAIAISHRRETGSTKTGQDRLIELDALTVEILNSRKAQQAAERLPVGPAYNSAENLVFTLPDGRRYHPERLSREFERKQATYNRLHPTTLLPVCGSTTCVTHGQRWRWKQACIQRWCGSAMGTHRSLPR